MSGSCSRTGFFSLCFPSQMMPMLTYTRYRPSLTASAIAIPGPYNASKTFMRNRKDFCRCLFMDAFMDPPGSRCVFACPFSTVVVRCSCIPYAKQRSCVQSTQGALSFGVLKSAADYTVPYFCPLLARNKMRENVAGSSSTLYYYSPLA